jgi:hypothetical protein
MKTYTSILGILLIATLGAAAQEKQEKSISPATWIKTAFQKKFPAAKQVKWEKENDGYEVNFINNGTEMSANYDAKGKLEETETTIAVSTLPSAAGSYIQQHFKGKTINEAAKIVKADGTVNYEAQINKSDLLFDASGKFIKIAKD